MVVDAVYNIFFLNHKGGYYGIKDLAKNDQLLADRIQELRNQRGVGDKINYYDIDQGNYLYTKTINGDKNAITRAAALFVSFFSMIHLWFVDRIFLKIQNFS